MALRKGRQLSEVCRTSELPEQPGNTTRDIQASAYLYTTAFKETVFPAHLKWYKDRPICGDGGMVMSVIENNTFSSCDEGIQLGSPTLWSVVRHNKVETKDPATPKIRRGCDDV